MTALELKILRLRLGITQGALAKELGWHIMVLSGLEQGRLTLSNPDAQKIREKYPEHFPKGSNL